MDPEGYTTKNESEEQIIEEDLNTPNEAPDDEAPDDEAPEDEAPEDEAPEEDDVLDEELESDSYDSDLNVDYDIGIDGDEDKNDEDDEDTTEEELDIVFKNVAPNTYKEYQESDQMKDIKTVFDEKIVMPFLFGSFINGELSVEQCQSLGDIDQRRKLFRKEI